MPGDGIDGYAVEQSVGPATSGTRAPQGYSAAEAATLTCARLTAGLALFVDGCVKLSDTVLAQGEEKGKNCGRLGFDIALGAGSGLSLDCVNSWFDKLSMNGDLSAVPASIRPELVEARSGGNIGPCRNPIGSRPLSSCCCRA